jgi:hypothetical protein
MAAIGAAGPQLGARDGKIGIRFAPGAGAGARKAALVHHRIMDAACNHGAIDDGRRHYAKQRQTGRIIGGAVDRVDHKGKAGPGKAREQRGIRSGSFLADH